ncbi:MAG: NAD(P)H-dependent FMN reductase [Chromatiales bacterium USCg_Taylor]|nr:MAG: NAD(P)H-dependent FMN reductase [Chromatiales bacterium USCg_Taylor]
MSTAIKVLGICGSLRQASYNAAALRAAQELAPAGKPAAVMGASMSLFGSARAQYHLRQSLIFLDVHFLNKPEVMIAQAQERFDAQGKLTHEPTRELIAKLLAALADWTQQLKPRS